MNGRVLELQEVETYYGKSHILHGVSLEVGPGEVVALLGRNGVGKTTTLRSIMGLTPPRAGRIRFQGREITGLSPHRIPRLGIGYVPQGRHIFPDLTVLENLRIALVQGRLDEAILRKILHYFPKLETRLAQRGGSLSGGEQQMLAIGRVLVTGPRLILMDEPTEGLQPSLVDLTREIIQAIRAEGVSILLVEQNLEMALKVSHRSYIMEKGAIVFQGRAGELAENHEVQLRHLGVRV